MRVLSLMLFMLLGCKAQSPVDAGGSCDQVKVHLSQARHAPGHTFLAVQFEFTNDSEQSITVGTIGQALFAAAGGRPLDVRPGGSWFAAFEVKPHTTRGVGVGFQPNGMPVRVEVPVQSASGLCTLRAELAPP